MSNVTKFVAAAIASAAKAEEVRIQASAEAAEVLRDLHRLYEAVEEEASANQQVNDRRKAVGLPPVELPAPLSAAWKQAVAQWPGATDLVETRARAQAAKAAEAQAAAAVAAEAEAKAQALAAARKERRRELLQMFPQDRKILEREFSIRPSSLPQRGQEAAWVKNLKKR